MEKTLEIKARALPQARQHQDQNEEARHWNLRSLNYTLEVKRSLEDGCPEQFRLAIFKPLILPCSRL